MSGTVHGARTDPRELVIFGIILIAVGVGAFAANVIPDAGALVLLVLGLALLMVFAMFRTYGALIPGGIMTGLGAGILASEAWTVSSEQQGGLVVGGLALGFLSIWAIGAISRVPEHHPWPLVPGGILAVVSIALLIGGTAIELLVFWPIVLIAGGAVLLWRAWMTRRHA
jgi:hypothetical protein